MSPAGTIVKFRETIRPDASYAEPGDMIVTITGRRYEVVAVDGKRIEARVMRMGEADASGKRIIWIWNAKTKAGKYIWFWNGTRPDEK